MNHKIIGKGNTADVLEYATGKVCKLFFDGYPQEYVELEYQNAKELFQLKLQIPEPLGVITIKERTGIIYERIDGETLLSLMNGNENEKLLNMFASLHREWLHHHSDNVLSYKEYLTAMVQNRTRKNNILIEKINALPDDDFLLHGDFHPNNILIAKNDVPVIIDFMNVCHGPVLYDIARTFFLFKQENKNIANSYLRKMNVLEEDIAEYIHVIEQCRKYEGH